LKLRINPKKYKEEVIDDTIVSDDDEIGSY